MASSDHLLISKIIQTRSLAEIDHAGLRPYHLSPDKEQMLSWILDQWHKYSEVPSKRAFEQEFGDMVLLNTEEEPFERLIDEIYDSYKRKHLSTAVALASQQLNDANTEAAMKLLSDGLQTASVQTAKLRDVDIIQTWEQRVERYRILSETPNALRGIPTGFNGLDRITSGFRPQQLVTFVGEAKKGKSLMTLIMTTAAHNHGISPMYVSFEMSIEEQEARYDAIISNVSHNSIIRGDLTLAELKRIEEAVRVRKNMHPFYMTEDTSSLTTVSAIAQKIQQHRPGLVVVDGVYLMDDEHGEPKGSPQALTNITRGLKRIAQRFDIPIIGTTQVLAWKLGNKKSRQITSDAIGYTSSFAQDSDLILGVESDPDIDNQAILRVVLARSAPKGEIRIKWDWDNMDFTEVGEDDTDNGWNY